MALTLWQYALLLVAAFAVGGISGALILFTWQEATLRREVDLLLQELPET